MACTLALKTVGFTNPQFMRSANLTRIVIEKVPKAVPPIYTIPPEPSSGFSRLRRFIGLPNSSLLILGLRRPAPIVPAQTNSNNAITICTSVGFRQEQVEDYIKSADILRPDVFVGPADIVYSPSSSQKRREKMTERTAIWMEKLISNLQSIAQEDSRLPQPAIFAPILPLLADEQRLYLSDLSSTHASHISGLAIYDPSIIPSLPQSLSTLPRLSLSPPSTPQELLQQLSLGIDLTPIPFINAGTDAGIALTFIFPAPQPASPLPGSSPPTALGIDLWPVAEHATSMTPLSAHCNCFACKAHSRAYLNHLLQAKEMLGWVLLQVHNHAIMDAFFAGVRASIAAGTFEADKSAFEAYYEGEFPIGEGRRPRLRGYELKSKAFQEKPNTKAYNRLESVAGMQNGEVVDVVEEELAKELKNI
jgi:queuine tRNA-ribosyltransferase accessory subunit